MRNFLNRMREGFQRFMIGRYGADQLTRFLIAIAFVFVVLNLFFRQKTPVFSILVWVILILAYYRMFSKNIQKRYDENTRYLMLKEKVLGFFKDCILVFRLSQSISSTGNPFFSGGVDTKNLLTIS